jgi:hypothetical protein
MKLRHRPRIRVSSYYGAAPYIKRWTCSLSLWGYMGLGDTPRLAYEDWCRLMTRNLASNGY